MASELDIPQSGESAQGQDWHKFDRGDGGNPMLGHVGCEISDGSSDPVNDGAKTTDSANRL